MSLSARRMTYFAKIDELGGMVEAVKRGFPQREIADAAYTLQQDYDSRRRILVGVNDFTEGEGGELELHRVDPALERKQTDRVQAVRARRDTTAVETALARATRRRGRRGQPDGEPSGLRPRTRHRRRDHREPPTGLRRLHRNPSLLAEPGVEPMRKRSSRTRPVRRCRTRRRGAAATGRSRSATTTTSARAASRRSRSPRARR